MSKITKTVLDPSKKVGRVSFSSEHESPLYYDKEGKRIPFVEVEEDYQPSYDGEMTGLKGLWNRHEVEIFRDCFTQIATLRSRWKLTLGFKYIGVKLLDKYILRHLGWGKDTRGRL